MRQSILIRFAGLLSFAVVLALTVGVAAAESARYEGEITTSSPWSYYDDYYYAACEFTVDADGVYSVTVRAANESSNVGTAGKEDISLVLYADSFSPSTPGVDYLTLNFVGDTSISYPLESGRTYIVVTSSQITDYTGTFENEISGPGDIDLGDGCGDGGGAGGIAGNLLDGRINNNPAFDVAAPVAVYCTETTGFDVYAINPVNGEGTLVVRVLAADLDAIAPGANSVLIQSSGGVSVYRLPSGEIEVDAAYSDGKPYRFVWNACPVTDSHLITS